MVDSRCRLSGFAAASRFDIRLTSDVHFRSAIVRIPGPAFAAGLTTSAAQGRPDLGKALEQHDDYCEALLACGVEVTALPPDERFPDSVFVEDTAVVAVRVAVLTRPGAPSRVGEVPEVAAALRQFRPELEQIEPPGTVDGGDVCQADDHFFIGLSRRTNEVGATQLATILARHGYAASMVDIRGHQTLLHLKSGLAYLGDRRFAIASEVPRTAALADYEMVEVDAAETYAANCVRVNGIVLVAAGYPKLTARLVEFGLAVRHVEVSEFRKMDGGLSCLSLRF
ncbi:MAG: arginine deiminase family protein [Steroidobacteraceae bacterium]